MKIISLVDNVSNRENIASEHGLSMYIEYKDKKLLFDMGQSELFSENAEKLCDNFQCSSPYTIPFPLLSTESTL